uniref:Uncharacterized protein n=1 Tax=Timema poppense TaxID=170557 RepID=A0A7R9GU71_TIMPO|nr:unnamed protein product [Timema poppensis]
MSFLDDPNEYLKNPYAQEKEYGDFTAFYITITICTVFGAFLFLLNVIFCCCSRYKEYWQDSNTGNDNVIIIMAYNYLMKLSLFITLNKRYSVLGNRWLIPIWTKTPNKQPPLDYTELENNAIIQHLQQQQLEPYYEEAPEGYLELKKRESDL